MLFGTCQDGEINSKQFVRVAESFQVSVVTIRRVWRQTLENVEAHLMEQAETHNTIKKLHQFWTRTLPLTLFPDHVHNNKKKGVVGKKRKYDRSALVERALNAPPNQRGTERGLAAALDVSKTTARRLIKEDLFVVVNSSLKPTLTDVNKDERFQFCLSFIDVERPDFNRDLPPWHYETMCDVVHVDEKWFDKQKISRRFTLAAGEEPPARTVKHKSHIEKVMFLCAQARPRYDPHRKTVWDGKIALCPIGEYSEAKVNSKHCRKGDPK